MCISAKRSQLSLSSVSNPSEQTRINLRIFVWGIKTVLVQQHPPRLSLGHPPRHCKAVLSGNKCFEPMWVGLSVALGDNARIFLINKWCQPAYKPTCVHLKCWQETWVIGAFMLTMNRCISEPTEQHHTRCFVYIHTVCQGELSLWLFLLWIYVPWRVYHCKSFLNHREGIWRRVHYITESFFGTRLWWQLHWSQWQIHRATHKMWAHHSHIKIL